MSPGAGGAAERIRDALLKLPGQKLTLARWADREASIGWEGSGIRTAVAIQPRFVKDTAELEALADLANAAPALLRERDGLKAEVTELRTGLDRHMATLEQENESLREANGADRDPDMSARLELASAKRRIDELEADRDSWRSQVATLDETTARVADERDALKAEVTEWRSVFGHLGKPDEAGNKINAYRENADALVADLRGQVAHLTWMPDDMRDPERPWAEFEVWRGNLPGTGGCYRPTRESMEERIAALEAEVARLKERLP